MRRLLTDRRVLLSVAIIGGLAGVALWPQTVAVDVARVSRGPLVVTIDEEGRTRVRDRFVVAATSFAATVRRIEPAGFTKISEHAGHSSSSAVKQAPRQK